MMTGLGVRRLAWPGTANVLGGCTLALALVAISLDVLGDKADLPNTALNIVLLTAFGVVGLVVARARPRNAVGWLLLAGGLLEALSQAGGAYAVQVYRLGHHGWPLGPAAILADLLWSPALVILGTALLLYPDGGLTRRWRRVLWSYLLVGGCWPVSIYAIAVSTIAGHRVAVDGTGDLTVVDSPSGSASWLTPLQQLILPLIVVFWLLFVGRQIARYRGSTGERRAQLKWLMWGAAVLLVAGAVVILAGSLDQHPSTIVEAVEVVGDVTLMAFPLSIGIGILRYRLYEIDRVISRTLAYAIVTGLLVGCYVGVVALGTDVLPFRGSVAVAFSTLAVAALFNPVRRRVQRIVDHRFNRAGYDADQMITAFAARLQDAVELSSVRDDLLEAVNRSLEPAHASVWVNRDVGAQTDTGPPRREASKSPVPSAAPAPGPAG